MEIQTIIIFNGVEYRLMGKKRYYLSQSTTNEGRRHAKGLHVAVWEFYSGQEVPKGYIIHHKDGNYLNNDYSNLECVSRKQHFDIHKEELKKRSSTPEHKEHLEKIRELATEWHKSKEGREWHKQHAQTSLSKAWAFREERICEYCGEKFIAKTKFAKCCCRNHTHYLWVKKQKEKSL